MSQLHCLNCGTPTKATYDLVLRGNDHDDVPLCDACHEAIQQEMADPV